MGKIFNLIEEIFSKLDEFVNKLDSGTFLIITHISEQTRYVIYGIHSKMKIDTDQREINMNMDISIDLIYIPPESNDLILNIKNKI